MNKLFLSLLVILMPAFMASCCLNKSCPVKEDAAAEETTEVQGQEIEAETDATAEATTEEAGH